MKLFAKNLQNAGQAHEASPLETADNADILKAFGRVIPEYAKILFIKTDLRLVVDLQNNVKAQQSQAYAQKVKVSNLQQMAKTIAYVQENGFDSREELQSAYDDLIAKRKDARKALRHTEDKLKSVNQLIHYTGQYLANKDVHREMLKTPNKKRFRQEHQTEIELYETAFEIFEIAVPGRKNSFYEITEAGEGESDYSEKGAAGDLRLL